MIPIHVIDCGKGNLRGNHMGRDYDGGRPEKRRLFVCGFDVRK